MASGPQSAWKTKDEVKAVLVARDYQIRKIKTGGGCYEFYTLKDGKRLEIFINPATLDIAKIREG